MKTLFLTFCGQKANSKTKKHIISQTK